MLEGDTQGWRMGPVLKGDTRGWSSGTVLGGRARGDAICGTKLQELLEVALTSCSLARMGSPYLGMGVRELLGSALYI
jgi:hypothetical protein